MAYLRAGGRLLYLGRVAQRDLDGRPCTVLADALAVAGVRTVVEDCHVLPTVLATPGAPRIGELRVASLQQLVPKPPGGRSVGRRTWTPLLTDLEGRVCAVEIDAGSGRAILVTAEIPALPDFVAALAARLGVVPGLRLRSSVVGVLALSTRSRENDRLLHLLNPTGYEARVHVTLGGENLAPGGWTVPPLSGHILALGVRTDWGRIERATSEVVAIDSVSVTFAPSLDTAGHRIELRTDRTVRVPGRDVAAHVSSLDGRVVVTAWPSNRPLELELC